MRDPIIDSASANLMNYLKEGKAGRKAASDLAEADDIVAGLVEWCQLALREADVVINWDGRYGFSRLLGLPSKQSPLRALDRIEDPERRSELRELLKGLLENGGRDDANALAWMLGQAIAKALVECLEHPNEMRSGTVSGMQNMATENGVTYFSFEDCLAQLLANSPSAFVAMLSVIDLHIKEISDEPAVGNYSRDVEKVNLAIDHWRSLPSAEKILRLGGHEMPVYYRMLDLLPIVAPLDRTNVLQRLDELDFPEPVRQVLGAPEILHDRDEIAALLKAAPSCIDGSKSRLPWNQKLTALLLLETAEEHCRNLWREAGKTPESQDTDEGSMQQAGEALSAWIRQLCAIVMQRSDGRFLGAQWLLRKSADERKNRDHEKYVKGHRSKELREEQLIEWIANGLFDAGLSGRDVECLVDLPGRLPDEMDASPVRSDQTKKQPELPRLGALAMSALLDHMNGQPTQSGMKELLERLDALLALRDPTFDTEDSWTTHFFGLPASCCGYLFAQATKPAERWEHSWNLLVEQRRRAQHWRETKDGDALAPSLFVLAAGIAALEWLISDQDRSRKEKEELWRAAFDGARDLWLTVPLAPFSERIERRVEYLFALHPRIFGASHFRDGVERQSADKLVNDCYGDRLAKDLSLLGGNDLVVVNSLINARQNGASLEMLREALNWREGHIRNIINQFKKWQEAERPIRKRHHLVEMVNRLMRDLKREKDLPQFQK